jgi:hypothetical protein
MTVLNMGNVLSYAIGMPAENTADAKRGQLSALK